MRSAVFCCCSCFPCSLFHVYVMCNKKVAEACCCNLKKVLKFIHSFRFWGIASCVSLFYVFMISDYPAVKMTFWNICMYLPCLQKPLKWSEGLWFKMLQVTLARPCCVCVVGDTIFNYLMTQCFPQNLALGYTE